MSFASSNQWYTANTFPYTTTAATTNVFNYQQGFPQAPSTPNAAEMMRRYLQDSGGTPPPNYGYPVLRRQMPGSDTIEWVLSNGAQVQFSGAQVANNHRLPPAPFTPAPVAAAPPPEHDDMTWLREQVAEVRELAFA